jgi:hypothetical protein
LLLKVWLKAKPMAGPNRFRESTPDNKHGKLYEARAAKTLGARLQPASGAMAHAKGDMKTKNWLLESKTTVNASLSVELGWLVKVSEEALAQGKRPGLVIGFVLKDGRPRPNCESEWVAMPMSHYKELTEGS